MEYTKLINEAASIEEDWHTVAKIANQAMMDKEESFFGLKKGVFNIVNLGWLETREKKQFIEDIKLLGFTNFLKYDRLHEIRTAIKDGTINIDSLSENTVILTPIVSAGTALMEGNLPFVYLHVSVTETYDYSKPNPLTYGYVKLPIENVVFNIQNVQLDKTFVFTNAERIAANRDIQIMNILND